MLLLLEKNAEDIKPQLLPVYQDVRRGKSDYVQKFEEFLLAYSDRFLLETIMDESGDDTQQ